MTSVKIKLNKKSTIHIVKIPATAYNLIAGKGVVQCSMDLVGVESIGYIRTDVEIFEIVGRLGDCTVEQLRCKTIREVLDPIIPIIGPITRNALETWLVLK